MIPKVELDTKRLLISRQPIFANLNRNETDALAALLTEKHFQKGESLTIEGGKVDCIYLIVSGSVNVEHHSRQNQKIKINAVTSLGPEDAVGLDEEGFYSKTGLRTATVVATTNVVTLRLTLSAFHRFLEAHPQVNAQLRNNVKIFLNIDF